MEGFMPEIQLCSLDMRQKMTEREDNAMQWYLTHYHLQNFRTPKGRSLALFFSFSPFPINTLRHIHVCVMPNNNYIYSSCHVMLTLTWCSMKH